MAQYYHLRSGAVIQDTENEYEFHLRDGAVIKEFPAAGWTGTVNGVTNPSAVNGVLVANITNVNGVVSS